MLKKFESNSKFIYVLDVKLHEISLCAFLAPNLIDHPGRETGPASKCCGWQ